MKLVIRAYYLIYILLGGFRHFNFEYTLFDSIQKIAFPIQADALLLAENVLLISAIFIFFKPQKKQLHLFFFFLLFFLDIYFNNFIKFEKAVLCNHLFPFFAFVSLSKFNKKSKVLFLVLAISIPFITTALLKIKGGWLSLNNFVIYDYLVFFTQTLNFNYYLASFFLEIKNALFWKTADFLVIIFQLTFFINFFTIRYSLLIFIIAIIFHISILLILNIGIFIPCILSYLLIISLQNKTIKSEDTKPVHYLLILTIGIIFYYFYPIFPHLFLEIAPNKLYIHFEFILNIIVLILSAYTYIAFYNKSKTLLLKND